MLQAVKPVVNIDDPVAKTVGRRTAVDPLRVVSSEKRAKIGWSKAGFFPRIPKGVYRFSSHEEADQWLMNHLTRKREN
jgi:hypothetical protein